MRIHSDKLTPEILRDCLANDPRFDNTGAAIWRLNSHRSTKRKFAFEVRIGADAGKDRNGKTRRPSMGGGYHNPMGYAENYTEKALTYNEWGYWIANVFEFDPDAIIGPYDGVDDFVATTNRPWSNDWALNGYEPFYACDWAFYNSPSRDAEGVQLA